MALDLDTPAIDAHEIDRDFVWEIMCLVQSYDPEWDSSSEFAARLVDLVRRKS